MIPRGDDESNNTRASSLKNEIRFGDLEPGSIVKNSDVSDLTHLYNSDYASTGAKTKVSLSITLNITRGSLTLHGRGCEMGGR